MEESQFSERGREKLRAAMIFWRRQLKLSWEDCWHIVNQLEPELTSVDCRF